MKTGLLDKNEVIFNGFELFKEHVVESLETSFILDGLDGDTDEEYLLQGQFESDASAAFGIRLGGTSIDSGTNYHQQKLIGISSSILAGNNTSINEMVDQGLTADTQNYLSFNLKAKSGGVRTSLSFIAAGITGTTVSSISKQGDCWINTTDNLTMMQIFMASGNFKVGSVFRLYRRRRSS